MKNALDTYTLKIETVGPVYIGSGRKIMKKDYILTNREALIPDQHKLYEGLRMMKLNDEYENYILDGGGTDLGKWLKNHNVQRSDYMPWISYRLDSGEVSFDNNKSREIHTFIKDAYGLPYIPGSSVKGMLRTILLGAMLFDDAEKGINGRFETERMKFQAEMEHGERRGKSVKFLAREADHLEKSAFHLLGRSKKLDDKVNDVMAAIRVGDSRPLSMEDLVLCQKVELKTDGNVTLLPMVRECIRPQTIIECPLTIDKELMQRTRTEITPKRLRYNVQRFYEMYRSAFRDAFKDELVEETEEEFEKTVFLGGGCGFVSKTVVYPMFGREQGLEYVSRILRSKFSRHKHERDMLLGVSPHIYKLTYYDEYEYEMGKCLLTVEKKK